MRKAGGMIALIAGIFAVIAAILTLMIGGAGAAFEADGAQSIVLFGAGGIVASFLCIVLGAVAMNARSRIPGFLLILVAVAGAILGGTLVALFMSLALIGGVLALVNGKSTASVGASA